MSKTFEDEDFMHKGMIDLEKMVDGGLINMSQMVSLGVFLALRNVYWASSVNEFFKSNNIDFRFKNTAIPVSRPGFNEGGTNFRPGT